MKCALPVAFGMLILCLSGESNVHGQGIGGSQLPAPVAGSSIADQVPLAGPGVAGSGSPQLRGQEDQIVLQASAVLKEIMDIPAQRIPVSLLKDAEGIAIVPNVIKGGFVIGGRRGNGVVLVRDDKGSWHAPSFITLTGGSIGFQAGIQSTDVILVFKTRKSVDGLLQGKFTLGGDAAVAAGPVGREAAAATDGRLRAEIYSYSRSRGLFAGVSLDGSMLQIDAAADANYYGAAANGQVQQVPAPAIKLIEQVISYTSEPVEQASPNGQAPAALNPSGNYNQPGTFPQGNSNNQYGTAQPYDQYGNNQKVGTLPAQNVPSNVALRQDLAAAWPRLAPLLDNRWQSYLAMPREVFSGQSDPSMDTLATVLSHYDIVAADSRYRLLTEKQSFQTTHQLVREYYRVLQNTGTLQLGNPPR
jgi:SH3 domain-containing YSC84-like protein 1